MRILILGATGFIGNALFNALVSEHEVIAGSRFPIAGYDKWRKVDFNNLNNIDGLLDNVDMVINAIGIASGDFSKIQTESPLQIFQACKAKDIKIINISAIGAEKEKPLTPFLRSKKIADDYILTHTMGKVIYPGIVLGEAAISSKFFKELAEQPIIPMLGDKENPFVHIAQLTETVKDSIRHFDSTPSQVFAVAEPESLKDIFQVLKGGPIRTISIPMNMVSLIFKFLPNFKVGVFDKNMFALLKGMNASDYEPIYNTKASTYLANNNIQASNDLGHFYSLLAISFIWIWSGIISLYSWEESLYLMMSIGITDSFLAPVSIIAGSAVDLLLGVAVFLEKYRKLVLKLQVLFIVIYMVIITLFAPEYWLHPFAPIAKNIPLLALIYLCNKNNK